MRLTATLLLLAGAVPCLTAQIPDFTPPTPLFGALVNDNNAELKRLLDAGANPNEGRFLGSPPIFMALTHQNHEAVRALIAKGADVKATDRVGATTLMWAAYNETGDTTLVKELLALGVDPNAKNKQGETALTWAMRRGYTPVVEVLKKHGASDAGAIRQSAEKAIALLQKSGPQFVRVSGCTSCHHQSLPQMAYALARDRGFHVDAQAARTEKEAVVAMFKPYREKMMDGSQSIPDPAVSVTYSMLGLYAEGMPADDLTEAMAHLVATQQNPDGSFRVLPARPPMESSVFTATALSLRSLQVYGKDSAARVARAREWLRTHKPVTGEDRAMHLLGLAWAKADAKDLRNAAQALIATQRSDGGWGQLPALESDAYATGQALVALNTARQLTAADPAYQRGLAYLLRTQQPDGSWHVRSRSLPFQPYKESGFPHGPDQWISASGTSWAAMALTLAAPPIQQVSRLF